MVRHNEGRRKLASKAAKENGFSGKVAKNAREQVDSRNVRQHAEFDDLYDKPIHNPFPPDVNHRRHVYLFDLSVLHAEGFTFSSSALALYPVIASRADFRQDTWRHISLDNLGTLAGLNRKTVRDAIDELAEAGPTLSNNHRSSVPLLACNKDDSGPRWLWYYRVAIVRPGWRDAWKGKYFPFYTSIIDSGVWRSLTRRAKALYLALRTEARFNAEIHDITLGTSFLRDAGDGYEYRKFEVCNATVAGLCRLAGVSRSRVRAPFRELEQSGLLAPGYGRGWLVFLAPQQVGASGHIEMTTEYQELAGKLADIVERRDRVRTNGCDRALWAGDIRKLVEELNNDTARVNGVLDWYAQNTDRAYVPRIDSGRALYNKFSALETAMQQQKRACARGRRRRRSVPSGAQPKKGKYDHLPVHSPGSS